MAEVRKATTADVDALGAALARAFDDDPVMRYLFPPRRFAKRLAGFMAVEAVSLLRHDCIWTTDDVVGAAMWAPPGQWRTPLGEVVKHLPALLPVFGRNTLRALKTLATVEKVHPREPHYYLAVLGTEPAAQGKGIGSGLLQPILKRCDDEGTGAYLESSKQSNIAFYARHGFEVMSALPLGPGAPTVWPMWREPRAA